MVQLYIAEDDYALARGMKFTLERDGYRVHVSSSCRELMEQTRKETPDLFLLDWNLPDGDGLELCRKLKETWDTPVFMITARNMEMDQVMCLEGGADDYIAKPFSLSVLKAGITALLRRSKGANMITMLRSGDIQMDIKKWKVYKGDQELECSLTECRLLKLFLEHKNQVLQKNQLLNKVWDDQGNFVEENTLSVNIRRLRLKLEDDPANPMYIKTIHGIGYLWKEPKI